jgi:hypothetical protein
VLGSGAGLRSRTVVTRSPSSANPKLPQSAKSNQVGAAGQVAGTAIPNKSVTSGAQTFRTAA